MPERLHHRGRRRPRGLTLPELLAVTILLGVAATLALAVPSIGRDQAQTLEGAATIEAVLTGATTIWVEHGRLPADPPCRGTDDTEDSCDPNPRHLLSLLEARNPTIELVGQRRDVADQTAPSHTALDAGQIGDVASIAWIAGDTSAAVGVAARTAAGECLLSRVDFGDRTGPQRYGIIPADVPNEPCQGETGLLLPEVSDPDAAGASWANPTRVGRDAPPEAG